MTISEMERKQRETIWEDENVVGFHSWVYDGLTLTVENCGKFDNGNWVRALELDPQGQDHVEFGRVFWHRHSCLRHLEKAVNAMADCRFPVTPEEPTDPEEQ